MTTTNYNLEDPKFTVTCVGAWVDAENEVGADYKGCFMHSNWEVRDQNGKVRGTIGIAGYAMKPDSFEVTAEEAKTDLMFQSHQDLFA